MAGTDITEAGVKMIVAFDNDNLQRVNLPKGIGKAALDAAQKQRPQVVFSY